MEEWKFRIAASTLPFLRSSTQNSFLIALHSSFIT
jgi:hypothetical protein